MERRHVLAGLASLVATPALAQSNPPPPTDAPAAPVPTAPPASPGPAPAMKMEAPMTGSDAATAWMKRTIAAGSLSLALSRSALGKAKNAGVRQFAEFETAEQNTIADVLKGKMMPDLKPTGEVKPPTDAEVAGNLDAKGKALAERMHAMKGGADFDREYVKAQVEGHRELMAIQETYLKTPDDALDTAVAKLALGMIKEHLALLADIGKHLD